MRYGIISDIHGNLEALQAVIERIGHVDAYICPGDIVGYGADPNGCCDILREFSPITVMGNHDAAALGNMDLSWFNPLAKAAAEWTGATLSDDSRRFLLSLPLTEDLGDLVIAHGSLHEPQRFYYIEDPWMARPSFDALPRGAQVAFVGHTHITEYYVRQRGVMGVDQLSLISGGTVELRDGFSYLVNCGSVGQPRDGNPEASCGMFDAEKRTVEVFRVSYEIAAAQRKIVQVGLPRQLADRLAFGS